MSKRGPVLGMGVTFLLLLAPWVSSSAADDPPTPAEVKPVDPDRGFDPFYKKMVEVKGFPILASEKVSDYALLEAAYLVNQMIGARQDILDAMVKNKVRCVVMAYSERTTDVPEHSDLKPAVYWDVRARGLGATRWRPAISCGEENLLNYPGDPYSTENIFIHEFGHTIEEMGVRSLDPTFDRRLRDAYRDAIAKGLWKGTYAASNSAEYWAEAVQSWFDTNRENDSQHNDINTRSELKTYDPAVAALVEEVFGDTDWRYVPPRNRQGADRGHLDGYDPARAPRFSWGDAQAKYRAYQEAHKRSRESSEDDDDDKTPAKSEEDPE